MSLELVQLDDLEWSELVEAARGTIPFASDGAWTLLSPTDPGITLIELFAALLEQRLYWMDRRTDDFDRALLRLLDVPVRPAVCAATVMCITGGTGSVAAGTVLWLDAVDTRLAFTVQDALTLLPVASDGSAGLPAASAVGLIASGTDLSLDLASPGRAPCLWTRDGDSAASEVLLWLASPPPAGDCSAMFSLLFDLVVAAGIEPGWGPLAVDGVPAPAQVEFEYRCDGAWRSFARAVDGTAGFRRSGIVQLALPDASVPWEEGSGPALRTPRTGALCYRMRIRARGIGHTCTPRVRRLVPNVTVAEHRRAVVIDPGSAELATLQQGFAVATRRALPGARVQLPIVEAPPLASSMTLALLERDGDRHDWTPSEDLTRSGPDTRAFVVDRERAQLRFGDGLNGRIPRAADAERVELELRCEVGGGTAGNLEAGARWRSVDSDVDCTAFNIVPAAGGAEPESVADAVERAGSEFSLCFRAVTAADFTTLAEATPGVAIARARASVGRHPHFPCTQVPGSVTVALVPALPASLARPGAAECGDDLTALRVDDAALERVRAQLDAARLIGQELHVVQARYLDVVLEVRVDGLPADGDAARKRIADALTAYLHPLTGGGGGGWPFGDPLRPSALLRVSQDAGGPSLHVRSVSIGVAGSSERESCADVELGLADLPALRSVQVTFERVEQTAGGFL